VPNGFSLIEVLVALTVFAVAALALLRLTAVGLQGSGDLDRRLLREVVAGNLAAQWSTDPVQAGDGEGELVNAGRRFVWQRKVVRDHGVAVARIVVRLADAPGRRRWSARRGWRGHEKERGKGAARGAQRGVLAGRDAGGAGHCRAAGPCGNRPLARDRGERAGLAAP
jgi:general secretion pathway protein I